MKLLHTADWHIGRLTYNRSRAADHAAVLREITDLARSEKPDLILHAGDVWDGIRPAYSDLQFGLGVLRELAAVAPTVVLCGNHDSPELFRVMASLLGPDSRLHFIDKCRPPEAGGILTFAGGAGEEIRLAPVPFIHQNRLIEHFTDPELWMAGYADGVQSILDAMSDGLAEGYDPERHVLLMAAHLHVTGARFSKSERQIHVTDSYATRVGGLPAVSYAAYGHIHRPQELPGTVPGRYAGSPIPLDFGEEGEDKEVVIVEAAPGRPAKITPHRLSGGRPLKKIEGTLDEIERQAAAVGTALCLVTVHSDDPVEDLVDRVTGLLPEAVLLSVSEDCAARRLTVVTDTGRSEEERTFIELFREYLGLKPPKEAVADDVLALFERVMGAAEAGEPCAFPEIDALSPAGRALPDPGGAPAPRAGTAADDADQISLILDSEADPAP